MMRGIVEYAFEAKRLNDLFEDTAEAQYTRTLHFSLALAERSANLAILGVLEKTIRMVPLGPVINYHWLKEAAHAYQFGAYRS